MTFGTHRYPRRYAFVIPRFGEGIAGGAETLMGGLAQRLQARGDQVQVLATCAKDNRTWENFYPPGQDKVGDLFVRRFPVDERDLEVWIPKQISISEGMRLGLEDQLDWMANSVNSESLYRAIARFADDFDALIFGPYLFGTTFWGSLIRPDKSVLVPCLHDECYAYTDVIASMFRQVRGCLFNAVPERNLARRLYGDVLGGEVGMGFVPFESDYVKSLTPYFSDEAPYLLYIGRKETGKNVPLLIDQFINFKLGQPDSNLRLVIAGGGDFEDLHRPEARLRDDVIDIAHVSENDKHRLIRHAQVLCQPSVNESFSIVIMEGWLLGTPALVHSDCEVTRWHVEQSGGGLYFRDDGDFAAIMNTLIGSDHETSLLRRRLAEAGERYMSSRYTWSSVLERFDLVMQEILDQGARTMEPVGAS